MISIIVVLSILLLTIVIVAYRADSKKTDIALTEEKNECGCGKTRDTNGYCDGSHMEN